MMTPPRGWRDSSVLEPVPFETTLAALQASPDIFTFLGNRSVEDLQPIIRQRIMWSMVPDEMARERSAAMGANPASPDVIAREQADWQRRQRMVVPFDHILAHFTTTAADVMIRSKVERGLISEPTDEEKSDYTKEATSMTLAILVNLIDMGILAYGKAFAR